MAPNIATNKPSYLPGEIVKISGTGFPPSANVAIQVRSPSNKVIMIEQSSPDSQGHFTSGFKLKSNDETGKNTVYASFAGGSTTCTFITTSADKGVERMERIKTPEEVGLQAKAQTDPRKVVVVHGRNEKARQAMFDFLRSIDLRPIEWSEAVVSTGKSSPFIGEILDSLFSTAQAAIVLMTPDDEAHLRKQFWKDTNESYEKKLTPQARPNVLYEAGMAMGRYPDRSILVELGKLRPFSDTLGRYVVKLDNKPETRHILVEYLETVGCQVNRKGTDWLISGDFDSAIEDNEVYLEETDLSKAKAISAIPIATRLMGKTEKNARLILKILAQRPRTTRSEEYISAVDLQRETNQSPQEINDAVRILHDRLWAEWNQAMGTVPFEFVEVRITPHGRIEFERSDSREA